MSQTQTQRRADTIRRRIESYNRIEPLAHALQEVAGVDATVESGVPPTIHVSIDTYSIPKTVIELIAEYQAEVVPASINCSTSRTLHLQLRVPDLFSPVGHREFTKSGNSIIVRFPPAALERANVGLGDDIQIMAADGAVLLVEADE